MASMQIQPPALLLSFWGATLLHGAGGDFDELLLLLGPALFLGLGVAFWMACGPKE
jgi:hypothetical protein